MFNKYRQKFSRIIADEGLLTFFRKILRYFFTRTIYFKKRIIFELDLETSIPKISSPLKLSFRLAKYKDIESMDEEHYGYHKKGKKYSKDRLLKGDKCVLILHNNKIIGYHWIMKDLMEFSKFKNIRLSKDRVYTYKAWVLKKFRGKRVLNTSDMYTIDMLRKAGKRYWITTIAAYNKSSIKARERLGFKRVAKIIQFRFFGLRYDYISKENMSYLQGGV